MTEQHILILNKISEEAATLKKLCSQIGSVNIASSIEETITLVEKIEFNVLVVDESFARYSSLKGLFRATTSIVITGIEGKKLNKIAKSWPLIFYVDYHLVPLDEKNNESLLRTLITATEHSFPKIEVEKLRRAKVGSEIKLKEAYFEIKNK